MTLVFPGQEALELLERAGTTKDECTNLLKQRLSADHVQLCVFRKRVLPEKIALSDNPIQEGCFSFTYYISIEYNSEEKQFVAQFHEDGVKHASLDLLNTAESIFGSYVAKPLFISKEDKLQLTIWKYYDENMQLKFVYNKFTHEQQKNALRQYAAFLALGCRNHLPGNRMNSNVYGRFQTIATWSFPSSIAPLILELNASLGFLYLKYITDGVDDLRRLPVVAMHRDHGFHNLLCTSDGIITKAIDWGTELSCEPLGVSLARIEIYVKHALELRQEFWDCFTTAIGHFLEDFHEIRRAMKTAKDVGFVVYTLMHCKNQDQVTAYQLGQLKECCLSLIALMS